MPIPAEINSKITIPPAKNNITETVQPAKIPLKCWYQLDGPTGEKICFKGHHIKILQGQPILGLYCITLGQKG